MGVVRILSDRVANQIAAGEVVERPASIVKELVENSLDAGATRVEIEFRHGGRSYIRVEDNGSGMSRDDALLSLERHATSKIREAADLDRVLSFGFRGEALPSIASVSRFTLRTRDASSEHGTEIVVNGGKVVHVRECGMPVGTRIEVAQLFNSVPARRKFLKSDATEAAHVIQHARLHALAHPGVSFVLQEDGRTLFQSPVCESLAERVAEVFGRQLAHDLLPLAAEEGDLRVHGLVSRPGVARATRQEMVTFVNRRPVDSRTLAYAVLESYHTHLPKGRYPVAFLFLELPPAAVDVNVHPAKREVRFRDETQVRGFAIRTVLGVLRAVRDPVVEATPATTPATAPVPTAGPEVAAPSVPPSVTAPAASTNPIRLPSSTVAVPSRVASVVPVPTPAARSPYPKTGDTTRPASAPLARPAATARSGWRVLGDVAGGYSAFETPGGLVILDRVAASERVWFERLQRARGDEPIASQRLLLPVPLELDPVGAAVVGEHSAHLAAVGLAIEPFGRDFFRIEAIPAWLEPGQAEGFVRDLVALLASGRGERRDASRLRDELARAAAGRAASPANRAMSAEELERLVVDLLRCEVPHTSPAGRPVFIEINAAELTRRFHKQTLPRVVAED
jgi:DNA mismatch repair protein MutL